MGPQDWQRVKTLFQQALAQPPAARAAWVDAACAADDELRAAVQSLLGAYDESSLFMETPAVLGTLGGGGATAEPPVWIRRRVGAYRILRELGRGGMGRVFLAERADAQFDKQVAIKIVRMTADADRLMLRFGHERRILAALEHEHIARLLDAGTTDDAVPFVVMEYVDGAPIDEYCERHALSTRATLELFRRVCVAVDHAHQRSIIHRDIKPGNILVTADGSPKLLDFGIAKLLDTETGGGAQTQTGGRVLTPSYCAPEQVVGGAITPATDVYALGVLLYRLLTGRLPYDFANATDTEVARAVCEVEPKKPSAVAQSAAARAELAGDIDTIVLEALRKEPARRYASASALATDISRYLDGLPVRAAPDSIAYRARKFVRRNRRSVAVATLSAAAVIAALGIGSALRPRLGAGGAPASAAGRTAQVRSVAVLPFAPIAGADQGDNELGAGLADALVTELGTLKRVAVRAVSSGASRGRDPVEVGHDARADFVLTGAIQHSGDRLRVHVSLVRVADAVTEWSDRYDSQWTDVFRVQDTIAEQVGHALAAAFGEERRQRIVRRRTTDADAYQAYLKGRYFWNLRTAEGFQKALGYFDEAISRDAAYAPAYAGLADTYALLGSMPYAIMPPADASLKAKAAATKALAIDPSLAEAEVSLAFVIYSFDWDWVRGEEHFKKAIALDSEYVPAHYWYSLYLGQRGRAAEALSEAQRALDLEPLGLVGIYAVGLAHYFDREFDRAAEYARRALEVAPAFPPARRLLGSVYLSQGRARDAVDQFRQPFEVDPANSLHAAMLAHAYGRAGDTAAARRILQDLERASRVRFVPAAHIGMAYIGIGDVDAALQWLEKAYVERSQALTFVKVEPLFDPLRGDARFTDLVRRLRIDD